RQGQGFRLAPKSVGGERVVGGGMAEELDGDRGSIRDPDRAVHGPVRADAQKGAEPVRVREDLAFDQGLPAGKDEPAFEDADPMALGARLDAVRPLAKEKDDAGERRDGDEKPRACREGERADAREKSQAPAAMTQGPPTNDQRVVTKLDPRLVEAVEPEDGEEDGGVGEAHEPFALDAEVADAAEASPRCGGEGFEGRAGEPRGEALELAERVLEPFVRAEQGGECAEVFVVEQVRGEVEQRLFAHVRGEPSQGREVGGEGDGAGFVGEALGSDAELREKPFSGLGAARALDEGGDRLEARCGGDERGLPSHGGATIGARASRLRAYFSGFVAFFRLVPSWSARCLASATGPEQGGAPCGPACAASLGSPS